METNKIYNMDALEFLEKIEANSCNCVFIDPPYNINIGKSKDNGFNEFTNHKRLFQELWRVCSEHSFLIMTIRLSEAFKIYPFITESGFIFVRDLFWNKNNRMSDFANTIPYVHENILIFRKGNPKANVLEYVGEEYTRKGKYTQKAQCFGVGLKEISVIGKKTRKANTFINLDYDYIIDAPNKTTMKYEERTEHPSQKPLKLLKVLISFFSKEQDLIIDCFNGSGTTSLACNQLNRKFICCDISKDYCDIANKRLEQNTLNKSEEVKQEAMQSEARHSSQA
jgi:site-specific DNA-methyltransferase (adenine-specific)